MTIGTRIIRSPRGSPPSRKGRPQEAALRMLMNTLDPARIERRLAAGDLDERTTSLEAAPDRIEGWRRAGVARSIGLDGNAADVVPELLQRGAIPDSLMDQTSARDALNGDVAHGMSLAEAIGLRARQPQVYVERAKGFDIPGFVPEHVRPLFHEGRGPFRDGAGRGGGARDQAADARARALRTGNRRDSSCCGNRRSSGFRTRGTGQ